MISLPSNVMPPAGLMFYRCYFFKMLPLSFGNADCCVKTVEKNYYGYKFGVLWFSNPCDIVAHLHGW